MRRISLTVSSFLIFAVCCPAGNEKKKPVLPVPVLNARTVAVIIDPDAGIGLEAAGRARSGRIQEDFQ